jgi:hypothetical protein
MTNLARRLRKLEAGIVDSHGLTRFSPRWWEYWNEEFERMQTGEDVDLTGLTLADIDAMRGMDRQESAAVER